MDKKQWKDDMLIRAIRSANRQDRSEALFHLFHQMGLEKTVIRLVKEKGGDENDGQEVAQLTMIAFDRSIRAGKFKKESSLKTYFLSFVHFQWLNYLRGRKSSDDFSSQHHQGLDMSGEELFINNEQKAFLDKLLSQIGEKCEKLLRLYSLNYSNNEIAEMYSWKSGGIAKKAIYRCNKKMKQFLHENPQWKNLIK